MRAVIIGAGRGSRLEHNTAAIPKTLVEVLGRPMLEWILEALSAAGFTERDVVFIGGYAMDEVQRRYPSFTFVENRDWEQNNVLGSLLCAREHLTGGFVSTYGDIVYDGAIVEKLRAAEEDVVLGCDVAWRRRYLDRTRHPESDAEKLRADGRRVLEVSRTIGGDLAAGEFIGVAKLSAAGAHQLVTAYDRAAARHAGGHYREGRSFERAYLIDLLQEMLEAGTPMYREDTNGSYMEIDTVEDLELARRWWATRPEAEPR